MWTPDDPQPVAPPPADGADLSGGQPTDAELSGEPELPPTDKELAP